MSKKDLSTEMYEKLVSSYIESRNNTGYHLLRLAVVVLEAKTKLNKRTWNKWLKDTRVKLKSTQAKKLVAIAQTCQNNGQLTDLLNREGIEKTYVISRIPDEQKRQEFAECIIDVPFTVKQTQLAIQKMEQENKPAVLAIEEIKNLPKIPAQKTEKQSIPVEKFNKLKTDYDNLLKEKHELERKIQELSGSKQVNQEVIELTEPVDSDEPDFTVDEVTHSVVFKGKKIPISRSKKIKNQTETYLEILVRQEAEQKFGLVFP